MEKINRLVDEISEVANSGHDSAYEVSSRSCSSDNYDGYEIRIRGEFYNLPEVLDIIRNDDEYVAEFLGPNSDPAGDEGGYFLMFVTALGDAEGYLTTDEYFEQDSHAIAVVGYPLAGKSSLAEEVSKYNDTIMFEDENPDTIITELVEDDSFPGDSVIIDGVEGRDSINTLRQFFDEFTVVWVHADTESRLERGSATVEEMSMLDGEATIQGVPSAVAASDVKVENHSGYDELLRSAADISQRYL